MKLITIPYYFYGYAVLLPAYIIHELSHWAIAFVFWVLWGWYHSYKFPLIKIGRKFKAEKSDNSDVIAVESWYMYVEIEYIKRFEDVMTTVMPAVTTIAGIIYSSMYCLPLLVYILCNFHMLWLSPTDIKQLKSTKN